MEMEKISIVGAGLMGSGIAQVCAQNGYQVILRDIEEDLLEKGFNRIRKSLEEFVSSDKIEEEPEVVLERIEGTTELKKVADSDLVIEAVPEEMDLKKSIYEDLEEVCSKNTIFATNTSSLMVTDLATGTKRPEKFIGMHWFNPPQVMELIEIVRGAKTSDETFRTIVTLSERLGKKPIQAKDGPGFFSTRYLSSFLAEAMRLYEKGVAGVKEIDEMSKMAFNWPMGPFELADHVGLDTTLHILNYIYTETGLPRYAPPLALKKLVKAGYLGDKPGSKGGFYDYFNVK